MYRNRVLVPAVLALSTAVLAACGGGGAESSGKSNALTFVSYGSAFQENQKKAWQEPYAAATGTTFRNDGPPDDAKVKTMVEAGKVTWDVVDTGSAFAAQNCGTILEKLDLTQIDTSKYPAGTVTDCGVPAYFFGLHFLYNTKKYGANPPTTIADFFDTAKFPGQRMLPPEVAVGILDDALLADGVPADKLYPLDVDRALKKLDTIKKSVTLAKTYGQMQQMMVDNQVDMVLTVTARATSALNAGATFKPVWDKTILTWDSLVIPKGAPDKDAAMKFIAFTAKPEQSAKFTELANVLPANSDAKPALTAAQQQLNPNADDRKGGTVLSDVKWWSQNLDIVTRKYTAWQAG